MILSFCLEIRVTLVAPLLSAFRCIPQLPGISTSIPDAVSRVNSTKFDQIRPNSTKFDQKNILNPSALTKLRNFRQRSRRSPALRPEPLTQYHSLAFNTDSL